MIQSFRDAATADLFDGRVTGAAIRRSPVALWPVVARKLDQLNQAHELRDLAAPPGNRLEALRGDRRGQYSIRVNQRFRICFVWTSAGPAEVEVVDYHR
ncbi:MAG: type II toxin-antitoxin system RelE/ParE family toxin [Deltaproteobacteria bacterium]|nr:type II toxin-antitoxin system RelE/ParE family toxin [Deltaproteobacteria bacterium]